VSRHKERFRPANVIPDEHFLPCVIIFIHKNLKMSMELTIIYTDIVL
jgi:hypothetical protein